MGMLIVITFLALSSWTIISLFKRLSRQRVSKAWWIAFGVLFAAGVALGIWCAFFCEYRASARLRVQSFPIPVDLFHLEDGNWVDFPVPKFQGCLAFIANVIAIIALAELPLWFALCLSRKKVSQLPAIPDTN